MDNRTEQMADGVWRVETSLFVNAYVLANDGRGDGEGLTLVDTGTPSGGPKLVRSIRLLGLDPRAVEQVLLTHHHIDHAGSAQRFATSSAAPSVWVGAGDAPVVQEGRRPGSVDSTWLGRLLAARVPLPTPVPSAKPLHGGDDLAVCGGLTVVESPGHTAGHVAFHLGERGVLFAGDAVVTVPRPWVGPKFLASALGERATTLARLAGLSTDVLGCGHGPLLRGNVSAVLARLAERTS